MSDTKFTPSQIRYMIWLFRLSPSGTGVKNVALSTALSFSKASVHNMLRSLSELEIVTQESFGLAHLTEKGRRLAERYEICFSLLERKVAEVCGIEALSEGAICALLSDMPYEKLCELCRKTGYASL